MTWGNRFKMLLGLILVLCVVAAATVTFNQRRTHVTSMSATISAQHFEVGSDYAGTVSEAFVEAGDTVVEGEPMFHVQSLPFERDVELGTIEPATDSVASDGALIVRAATSGVVSNVALSEGAFAPAGVVLATIDSAGSLFAQAEFLLSPRDFGRIDDGAEVVLTLPDGRELRGTVTDIAVKTVAAEAHVTARVDCDALAVESANDLLKPGTPLTATLALRDDGPLAGVTDSLRDFVSRIGL